MNYTYSAVDVKYVFGKLEKGETVLIVDFKTMKCLSCTDLTVNQINYYKSSSDAVFFTRTETTGEINE